MTNTHESFFLSRSLTIIKMQLGDCSNCSFHWRKKVYVVSPMHRATRSLLWIRYFSHLACIYMRTWTYLSESKSLETWTRHTKNAALAIYFEAIEGENVGKFDASENKMQNIIGSPAKRCRIFWNWFLVSTLCKISHWRAKKSSIFRSKRRRNWTLAIVRRLLTFSESVLLKQNYPRHIS